MTIAKFLRDFDRYRAVKPVECRNGVMVTCSPWTDSLEWYLDGGMRHWAEGDQPGDNDIWITREYGEHNCADIRRACRSYTRHLTGYPRAKWIRQLMRKRLIK